MRAVLLALALGLGATSAHAACPSLDKAGLDKLAAAAKKPLNLIFFASWCTSCKEHLEGKHDESTVLIGVFDKQERIEATVKALGLATPCYFDDGISEALGVSSLPKQMSYPVR